MNWILIAAQQRQKQADQFANYARFFGEARLRQHVRMLNIARLPVHRSVQ